MGPMATDSRIEKFTDNGITGGSFESVTGISQAIDDYKMSYSLSCTLNQLLVTLTS